MNKKLKTVLIFLPIVAGAALVIMYIIKAQKSAALSEQPKQPSPAKAPDLKNAASSGTVDNSQFPLKKGSKNDYVKSLQDELGVSIDGIFGKDTLAALKEQTGKTQIDNIDDLNATIDRILAQDAGMALSNDRITRSNSIISNQLNGNSNLKILRDSKWTQVQFDTIGGSYLDAGYTKNWGSGQLLNLNDYQPFDITSDGYLIIFVPNGTLSGYWKVDPNNLTLV